MKHFKISVAGLYVELTARFPLSAEICRDYLTDAPWTDFTVSASPEKIAKKRAAFSVPLTEEQAECICLHEEVCGHLCRYDAFVMHAAAFVFRGRTYAIVAPRGVGKSTQLHLWQEKFGSEVRVINGDKPIVRLNSDGRFWVFGTPWCGKEGEQTNMSAPLDALCLLSRGMTDAAQVVTERQYLEGLIRQVVFPTDERSMARGARLLARLIRSVPAVAVSLTPTAGAVNVTLEALASLVHTSQANIGCDRIAP